jgi:hypothetical protein
MNSGGSAAIPACQLKMPRSGGFCTRLFSGGVKELKMQLSNNGLRASSLLKQYDRARSIS